MVDLNILVVLDASGSMIDLTPETISAYNDFVGKQREKAPQSLLSLRIFNTEVATVYNMMKLEDVPPLTTNEYQCGGFTSLYDAVGSVVSEAEDKLSVLLIITDGEDNSSQVWNQLTMQRLLDKKSASGWEIVYMGVRTNAMKLGSAFGARTTKVSVDSPLAIDSLSQGINSMRCGEGSGCLRQLDGKVIFKGTL